MKLLFWNLNNKDNAKLINEIVQEYDVDIALFAEYKMTDINRVIEKTDYQYVQFDGYGGCDKITLICKSSIEIKVKQEQDRYTIYTCRINDDIYNIVGIHLQANPYADSNYRKNEIRSIIYDIDLLEKRTKNTKTIVIGDFNCNPFDEEIIQKDAFNAVLFKQLIEDQEQIEFNSKKYRRFYNPAIHFISEDTKTYGSYYFSSGSCPLYWNSYDQLLVRKSLVDCIKDMVFIKQIKSTNLINHRIINDSISDHLPLYATIIGDK